MPGKRCSVCYSCGVKAEYTECSDSGSPPEDACCRVLSGWLAVSWWTGAESVDHYDFCSLVCLQTWVETQVPGIPRTFLEAFEEG
ncbi:hypothetical protein ACFLVX_03180 [Chloroflexota bacterium]